MPGLPSYEEYQKARAASQAKRAAEMEAVGAMKIGGKLYLKSDLAQGNIGVSQDAQNLEDDQFLTLDESASLGLPYGTPKVEARGRGIVPAPTAKTQTTDSQRLVSGYAKRLGQAENVFTKVNPGLEPYGPISYFIERNVVPGPYKSEPIKQQEQAERNFLNAVLRRESGAVISPPEFKEGTKQYFPRPGDTSKILAQKKANREQVRQNYIAEAGAAYQGEPVEPEDTTQPKGKAQTINPKVQEFRSKYNY